MVYAITYARCLRKKTRDSNLSSITPAPHFYYSLIRICPLCVDKDSGDDKACCLQVEINEGCCLPLCFEDVTACTGGDGKGGKNGKKYLVKSPKGMKGSKVPKVGGCPQREAVPSSRARGWSWRRAPTAWSASSPWLQPSSELPLR